MATREKVNLVMLLVGESSDPEANDAWDILGADAGEFGDNGGDPDGNLWLAAEANLDQSAVDRLVELGLAERVDGWKVQPYTGRCDASDWCGYRDYCGYQGSDTAFFMREADAILCQQDGAEAP
jgi:hypothetical protein